MKYESLQWIPEKARMLADVNAVGDKKWTLAEVCEHLALAVESTVQDSGEHGPPRCWRALSLLERTRRWFMKHGLLTTGWFPGGVDAPSVVVPSETILLDDALDHLIKAATDFDHKYNSVDATWGYHSLLGRMNSRMWRRFHTIHAIHHFSFFRAKQAD